MRRHPRNADGGRCRGGGPDGNVRAVGAGGRASRPGPAKLYSLPFVSWSADFRFRQHMRQSLWAVPLVGTVVGLGLASVDLWLEPKVDLSPAGTYSASAASSILTAVAAAMVGLVGLVVTVGVLVVQMATGTLSPRFMRLWYRDRLQKLVLASFRATRLFAYTLFR